MPKDAYYFTHDSNASDDPKIKQLLAVYGYEGLGWYWRLVEMMRNQADYELSITGKYVYYGYAETLKTSPEKAEQYIKDCIDEFGLFITKDGTFWSESLKRRMTHLDQSREVRREAGIKGAKVRWGGSKAIALPSNNNGKAMCFDSYKSKVNKSKVNIYIYIFNHWNEQGVIVHKKLTGDMKKAIDAARVDYSEDDLKQSISNYAEIVKGASYYFKHRWTLAEFLSRRSGNNIERFMDLEIAKKNFVRREDGIAEKHHRPKGLPTTAELKKGWEQ